MKRLLIVGLLFLFSASSTYALQENFGKLTSSKVLYEDSESVVEGKEYTKKAGIFTIKTNITYENGKEVGGNSGISRIIQKYDKKNNLIESSNYGTNKKLKADESGIAIKKFKYDIYGNVVEYSTYGENNRLIAHESGIAKEVRKYIYVKSSGESLISYYGYYGTDGRFTEDEKGNAQFFGEYDSSGEMISAKFYSAQGELRSPAKSAQSTTSTIPSSNKSSVSSQKWTKSELENKIKETETLISSSKETYNKSQQVIQTIQDTITKLQGYNTQYESKISYTRSDYQYYIDRAKTNKDSEKQQLNAFYARNGIVSSNTAEYDAIDSKYNKLISDLEYEMNNNIGIYQNYINNNNTRINELQVDLVDRTKKLEEFGLSIKAVEKNLEMYKSEFAKL